MRTLTLVAGCAWLVVAGYGVGSALDVGVDWEVTYMALMLAVVLGAVLSVAVAVAAEATRAAARPRLRMAGLVVGGLGCAAGIVAWALPLWMGLLGAGFALLAASSGAERRRPLVLLAGAQLGAIVVLIAGIEAGIGRPDEYGDYPVAGALAMGVLAGVTIAGLLDLRARWGDSEQAVAVEHGRYAG